MKNSRYQGFTVVVTGASSGLGRATALEFARQGANLGLIARGKEGLDSLAFELRALGREAEVCVADVADAQAVTEAARRVAERFGGIDIWVNNAAVSIYGELDQVPLPELRRVMDVNFFGQLHGVRAALPYLENSRRGRIIGILSVLAEAAVPLQGVYTAAKHALHGMYQSLAEELLHRRSRVKVSVVFAPSMATPLFDHAKSYMGYLPKPVGPVSSPEHYARIIAREAWRPRFRSVHGLQASAGLFFFQRLPWLSILFEGKTAYRGQRGREPKGIADGDNLFQPMSGTFSVRGTHRPTRGLDTLETFGGIALTALAALLALRLWQLSVRPALNEGRETTESAEAA
ncbi:MAG: SDR family oxidoreductase [Oligoflexia bacterium]|nr:SDR family oxidoreductase [Oligoflexia bacterium]